MATLKQIAEKGSELHAAFLTLESFKQDKQVAQDRVSACNSLIATQQALVDTLKAELLVLVNS